MARIDDYRTALALAREQLTARDPQHVARLSGAEFGEGAPGGKTVELRFLNRPLTVAWPGLGCAFRDSGDEVPIQQQILLFHYLLGAGGRAISGRWIAYQEVPDGKFYLDAFLRRSKIPFVQALGARPELLPELAGRAFGAQPIQQGDVGVEVRALPLVPVALILWRGDEEFPPEGNILFDDSIVHMLSAEDIAWLAGMVVYPLAGMARTARGADSGKA